MITGVGECLADLRRGGRPHRSRAQAARHLNQIHLQVVTLQPGRLPVRWFVGDPQSPIPIAELIAKLAATSQHLQPVNHLIAVVLRDHHSNRQTLLDGGDQLGWGHQERAVSDERDDPLATVRNR